MRAAANAIIEVHVRETMNETVSKIWHYFTELKLEGPSKPKLTTIQFLASADLDQRKEQAQHMDQKEENDPVKLHF